MFGMGWSEMMLVGIVALIVIGPKDLPGVFHQLGQFAGKARGMAREFTNAMNDAARESGVSDIQKTLNAAVNPKKFGIDKINEATGSIYKPDPAVAALSKERAESKAKFEAAAADMVHKRKAAEAPVVDPSAPAAPETQPVAAKSAAKPNAKAKARAEAKSKAAAKPEAAAEVKATTAKPRATAKPKAETTAKTSAKPRAPRKTTPKDTA